MNTLRSVDNIGKMLQIIGYKGTVVTDTPFVDHTSRHGEVCDAWISHNWKVLCFRGAVPKLVEA